MSIVTDSNAPPCKPSCSFGCFCHAVHVEVGLVGHGFNFSKSLGWNCVSLIRSKPVKKSHPREGLLCYGPVMLFVSKINERACKSQLHVGSWIADLLQFIDVIFAELIDGFFGTNECWLGFFQLVVCLSLELFYLLGLDLYISSFSLSFTLTLCGQDCLLLNLFCLFLGRFVFFLKLGRKVSQCHLQFLDLRICCFQLLDAIFQSVSAVCQLRRFLMGLIFEKTERIQISFGSNVNSPFLLFIEFFG